VTEGPAFGAAILAGVGTGAYTSIEAATDSLIKITSTTTPRPKHAALYEEYYQLYCDLYPSLKPHFDTVTRLVSRDVR